MTVYILLLFCVTALTTIAERVDYNNIEISEKGRFLHTRQTGVLFFLVSALLIFVAGFRYGVGTDYFSYYYTRVIKINDVIESLKELDEPVQELFYFITQRFTNSLSAPIFVFSLFTIGLSLKVIYDNTYQLKMSVLLFLFLGCWTGSFNAIRQCMAATIVFCGLQDLKNRRLLKYIIIIILAFLTHRSAIIMLVPFFILHNKINAKNIILLTVGTIIVLLSYNRLFSLTETIMQQGTISSTISYYSSAVSIFRVLVAVMPAAYFLFQYKDKELDDELTFYMNIAIVHAVLMIVASQSMYLARVSIYTAPFLAIAIPKLNSGLDSQTMKFGNFVMFILYASYWLYDISVNTELNHFTWIWNALG